MAKENRYDEFVLEVPLDASEIEDFKPEQKVKVLVVSRDETTQEQIVTLDKGGRGSAKFTFENPPGSLQILLGPEEAAEDELRGMQTLSARVSARDWRDSNRLQIQPILIAPYYWYWWLRWCRRFIIRGRVVCPDGSPVAGAKVCAIDVDYWWWWISNQQVGCATTDASGAFEIRFRWCCGWWPWWWWRYRVWQFEPLLAERILPVLQRSPQLGRIPKLSSEPSFAVFDQLIGEGGAQPRGKTIEPTALTSLREQLLPRLQHSPELERLRIWPWWPWYPWWDCTPDIIFKVTQDCQEPGALIVDEGFNDTRWNIPTSLNVTLIANDKACCLPDDDEPEGDCIALDLVCSATLNQIGGNANAAASPPGFYNPGVVNSYNSDRPFAGGVRIEGQFGAGATADWYEFEWSTDNATWFAMPVLADGSFYRRIFIPPSNYPPILFNAVPKSGRNVYESRRHYEATHPGPWGTGQFWTSQEYNTLIWWMTQNGFANGTYYLRVRTWEEDGGGNLINPQYLPVCNTQNENRLVLTTDNRIVTSGPNNVNGQLCSGTIHLCTDEPDTDIVSVKILHSGGSETDVGACGNVPINNTDQVQIDFVAHDPDGHLATYTLEAHWSENLAHDLLSLGGTLTPSPVPVAWAPAAAQVGPRYGDPDPLKSALAQGAASPIWHGGVIRLTMPATTAFPETCCYQLRLIAYKRTIDGCDYNYPHRNITEYSFMIVV